MLLLIGIGFTFGNWLGGKLAEWSLDGAAILALGAAAAVTFIMPLVIGTHLGAAIVLLVWGAAAFAMVPPVQTRVMQAASEAPGLASSINVGAFNFGNAVGAAVGGWVIHAGLGYGAVPLAAAAMAAGGVLLVLAGRRTDNRQAVPAT